MRWMPDPVNENPSPAPNQRSCRGAPIVSASFAASPASTCTPTHEPAWSWKPVSRASHQVFSQASECGVRQSSRADPEPLRSSSSRSTSSAAARANSAHSSASSARPVSPSRAIACSSAMPESLRGGGLLGSGRGHCTPTDRPRHRARPLASGAARARRRRGDPRGLEAARGPGAPRPPPREQRGRNPADSRVQRRAGHLRALGGDRPAVAGAGPPRRAPVRPGERRGVPRRRR